MPKKTFTPEQTVAKLRQVEVLVSKGKTVPLAMTWCTKYRKQVLRARTTERAHDLIRQIAGWRSPNST